MSHFDSVHPTHRRKNVRTAGSASVSLIAGVVAVAMLALGGVYYFLVHDAGPDREEALRLARSGKFAESEPALVELAARNPDDLDVREGLVKGYVATEKFVEAEPHADRLIELKPQNPDYYRLRIKVHKPLTHLDALYADTIRVAELDPSNENRRAALDQSFASGRFAEAEAYCLPLLKEAPKDRVLRSRLANIRRARGDDAGAAVVLDELIQEDAANYAAKFARGVLFDETGNPKAAVVLLRDVYEHDTTRRRTSGYQLAVALGKVGEQAEADRVMAEVRRLQDVEVYGTAIKNQPDNLHLHVRVAETMLKDGHTADGVGLLNAVLKKDPSFAPAHKALAAHFEKQGQADRAAHHRRFAAGGK